MNAQAFSRRKLHHRGAWRTYTTLDGLTDLQTEHIAEDHNGYLWFATWDGGVCRFDGDEFRAFKQQDGLGSDHVNSILIDRRGRFWFGTDRGLCWYDGEGFHPFTGSGGLAGRYVEFMFEDREGRLWVAGPGLLGYCQGDEYHSLAQQYCRQCGVAPERRWPHCWGITQDGEGAVWFGLHGLVRYQGGELRRCGEEGGLRDPDSLVVVAWDGQGSLWTGGGRRLWRGDGRRYQPVPLEGNGVLRKIQLDREGRVWFCTSEGVHWYDGAEFHHFTTGDGLAHEVVNAMLQDREGHFWFATWGGGISCYDPHLIRLLGEREPRPHHEACALLEDRRGRIWMGFRTRLPLAYPGEDSLASYDGQGLAIWGREQGLELDNCLAIHEDRQGCLWFGTRTRLLQYDGREWRPLGPEEGFAGEVVSAIAEDAAGRLYLGHLDLTRQRICLSCGEGGHFRTLFAEGNEGNNCINAIAVAGDGGVWFSRGSWSALLEGKGLCRWHEREGLVGYTAADGLPSNWVEDLCWDPQQECLWIATLGGLSRFAGGKCRNYTVADGLPSNHVRGVYKDRQGHLWLATDGGVVRYDGRIFQTIRSSGIGPANRVIEDRSGRFWFATGKGVICYLARSIPPRIRVHSVIADQIYQGVDKVAVSAATRQFMFEYKGISFRTHPRNMLYFYRLQGHQEEWQAAGNSMRAHYRDLPQGEYRFQVRAIDQDMNYSEVAAVALAVLPDPYLEALTRALDSSDPEGVFIGRSAALHKVKLQLREVASTDLTVLLLGRTGAGKGLAARTIHRMSAYKSGPFIQVNCGAVPESLMESELFGHERGAFTGAVSRKIGKAELAAGGTLFLDEIADLSPTAQVKLLRLLEERTFERVGGNETLKFEGRMIAATNKHLEQMVGAGQFREDLYFRLQAFPIQLPPLSERREDIPLLAFYFMERMARSLDKEITHLTPEALRALTAYDWPGNVRELEHTVQRAVIVCAGPAIGPQDLAIGVVPALRETAAQLQSMEEVERAHICKILEKTGWVIEGPRGAALVLGLPPSTLRNRMRKLGIVRS
jgi:DNA-binding NtrC family response regulator/ligand-binding sensor domain-containing protein